MTDELPHTAGLSGIPLPTQGRREREHLYAWVEIEEIYVAGKFDDERDGHDDALRDDGLDRVGFWFRQITQYYDRANAFFQGAKACDDPAERRQLEQMGQQALAKAMMTAKGCVESSIRVFGPMPKPGVSSGNIEPWG